MIISETLKSINLNSSRISQMIRTISHEISELSPLVGNLQRKNVDDRIAELKLENQKLEKQIEEYKKELISLRTVNGVPQISLPSEKNLKSPSKSEADLTKTPKADGTKLIPKVNMGKAEIEKPKSNDVSVVVAEQKDSKKTSSANDEDIHFGRLDIRVGKIVHVEKHPNADSLYVEQVDVGDEKPRTIISGLVKYVPIDQMNGRIALFLCNLKPAKMRGISSEGMIMCANDGEQCEILEAPAGCVPGDVITVEGFERKPDAQLNPKKKIFEAIQVDLKTNENRQATYRGIPWSVGGKGPALAKSLINNIDSVRMKQEYFDTFYVIKEEIMNLELSKLFLFQKRDRQKIFRKKMDTNFEQSFSPSW